MGLALLPSNIGLGVSQFIGKLDPCQMAADRQVIQAVGQRWCVILAKGAQKQSFGVEFHRCNSKIKRRGGFPSLRSMLNCGPDWAAAFSLPYYSASFIGTTETSCLFPLLPRNSTLPATLAKMV